MTGPVQPNPPGRMTSAEFLDWAAREDVGRVELIGGEVVAMAGETRAHANAKGAIYRACYAALDAAGSPCRAYVDGLAVVIDESTTFIPDVVVDCSDSADPNDRSAAQPVVVTPVVVTPLCAEHTLARSALQQGDRGSSAAELRADGELGGALCGGGFGRSRRVRRRR